MDGWLVVEGNESIWEKRILKVKELQKRFARTANIIGREMVVFTMNK